MGWTTRIPPDFTRQYGAEEIHSVWLEPPPPGNKGNVSLLIPECELQLCELDPAGVPIIIINRPVSNKSVRHWLKFACREAAERAVFLSLACDTAEQAERFARMAAKMLPSHRRVALERMYEPESRYRAGLN